MSQLAPLPYSVFRASPAPLAPHHLAVVGHAHPVAGRRGLRGNLLLRHSGRPPLRPLHRPPASPHCRRHRRTASRPLAVLALAALARVELPSLARSLLSARSSSRLRLRPLHVRCIKGGHGHSSRIRHPCRVIVLHRIASLPPHPPWPSRSPPAMDIRNFALTLGAVTLRIYMPLMLGPLHQSFRVAIITVSWLCRIPNALIAEWMVRRRPALV